MKIKIHGTEFQGSTEHPQEEGTFLWLSKFGNIDLITVLYHKSKIEDGVEYPGYYGIIEHQGKNVQHISGSFSKIEVKDIK